MKNKNLPDIDSDFLILPWKGGVQVVKPETLKNKNFMSVGNFFTFPFNIYFYDLQNVFVCVNEENALRHGHVSVNEPIGQTLAKFFTDESVQKATVYHKEVLTKLALCIEEEQRINRHDNTIIYSAISFKFPWYDAAGTLQGVFGCSVMPEVHNLPTTLSTLLHMGLFTNNPHAHVPGKQHNNHYLSQRELDCLKLLVLGNTAKMTAKYLGLSPRTVESYLENIKCKLNVSSRTELGAKAMELGLIQTDTDFDKPFRPALPLR